MFIYVCMNMSYVAPCILFTYTCRCIHKWYILYHWIIGNYWLLKLKNENILQLHIFHSFDIMRCVSDFSSIELKTFIKQKLKIH